MRSFLIGNSIVRDIRGRGFTTISLSGANWNDIFDYVKDRRDYFSNSVIYIHIGPVRFTRMHRARHRREVQLLTNNLGTVESHMEKWQVLREDGIYPVLCTLYPMEFRIYNNSLAADLAGRSRRRIVRQGKQILEGFYDDNTRDIKGMIVEENKDIIGFNNRNDFCTPFMHNYIFTRRRRYNHFRPWLLRDGLHPSREIVRRWNNEMERIVELNNVKAVYKWQQHLRNRRGRR